MNEKQALKELEQIYKRHQKLLISPKKIENIGHSQEMFTQLDLYPLLSTEQIFKLHEELHKNTETGVYREFFSEFMDYCLYYEAPLELLDLPLDLNLLYDSPHSNYLAHVMTNNSKIPIIEHYLSSYFKVSNDNSKDNLTPEEKIKLFRKSVLKKAVFSDNMYLFLKNYKWDEVEKIECFLEKHKEVPWDENEPMETAQRFNQLVYIYRDLKQEQNKNSLLSTLFELMPIDSVLNPSLDAHHLWPKLALSKFPIFLKFFIEKDAQFLENIMATDFIYSVNLPTVESEEIHDTENYQLNGLQFYFLFMLQHDNLIEQNTWKHVKPYFENHIQDIFKDVIATLHYQDKKVPFMDILIREKKNSLFSLLSPELFTISQQKAYAGVLVKTLLFTDLNLIEEDTSNKVITRLQEQIQMLHPCVLESIMERVDFKKDCKKLEEGDFENSTKPHLNFLHIVLEKNKLTSSISQADNSVQNNITPFTHKFKL